MNKEIIPIFIFSSPRSGSTLLQRIISTQNKVASTSEPWILLPFIYTLKKNKSCSIYGHNTSIDAIEDFYSCLPNNKEDYLAELRKLTLSLYTKASEDKPFFLDKTPRYSLIADDIYQIFPDGKFIILWRNPLAMIASVLNTWKNGSWSTSHIKVDLYKGLENLINLHEKHLDSIYSIKYEDLINDPDKLKGLFEYIGLEFSIEDINKFSSINFHGRMGDPTGISRYFEISGDSTEKWKSTLSSPIRKWWCRKYLKWIGEKRLTIMGYDLKCLLKELDEVPTSYKFIISDLFRLIYGELNCLFFLNNIKENLKRLKNKKTIYPYC